MDIKEYSIKAVLFDFDGTLTKPGVLDFDLIRKTMKCPADKPILEYIGSLEDSEKKQQAKSCLDRFELQAAAESSPGTDAQRLIHWIKQQGLSVGILTRNSRMSVLRALENFDTIGPGDFELILTRDDPLDPKPSPDGVLHFSGRLGIDPGQVLVVGDFYFDTQAGFDAGAVTVLLDPDEKEILKDAVCDFRLSGLGDLETIIREGLPLCCGKLPNEMLQVYLKQFDFQDPSVIINPGVGEDIAAVDVRDNEVLILKSDPITFATGAIGRYSVLVNANDIATSGAEPRWFLTTLLLPPQTTPSRVRQIMSELSDVSKHWNITLCGGHTEITDAVTRPVVIGMMAGTVRRKDLIDKKQMAEGDCVLLTKAIAVEGTAIIAREFGPQLSQKGFSSEDIAISKDFLNQIGILEEARLAARNRLATAMHDVTEGGLATALEELSIAGGYGIAVDMEKISVFSQTRKICDFFGLDPLGLIGSGSLLISCRPENCPLLIQRISAAGINVTQIGRVIGPGTGIRASKNGKSLPWPKFEADEITKLFKV
ncbi:MAG: HAD hydrolase-like protein [Desulfobacteraceae bacterium]|nr:HAD hydrolase-like protein [Desulfobacteraceae bacterium]